MSFLNEAFKEEFNLQLKQLRRITNHGPSIGRFIEVLLINLLKKYLPSSINFTSGFIHGVNVSSNSSKQIDIICYDGINYPVLFDIGEFKVIPAKAVKGLVEIKASLSKTNLKEILNASCNPELIEVPLTSKMYLLSTKSTITSKNTFNYIKSFYAEKPNINKFFSVIYSLDWNEIISFRVNEVNNKFTVQLSRLLLSNTNDIAVFISHLLLDLHGVNAYESIHNHLGPSLFHVLETHELHLYTKD